MTAGADLPRQISRLVIRPDPKDDLAVYAVWINAGDAYMIFWGDGDADHMPHRARPARHRYTQPGTYSLVAKTVSTGHKVNAEVTVPPPPPVPDTARIRWWAPADLSDTHGQILLSGFPPNAIVDVRFLDPYTTNPVQVDADGGLSVPATVSDSVRGRWFTVTARWTGADGKEKLLYQPVKPHAMIGDALVPTYDFAPGNPKKITLRAYTGRQTLCRIYWGDGQEEEVTPKDGWIELGHEYGYYSQFVLTVQERGGAGSRSESVTVDAATVGKITDGPDYVDYDFFFNPGCGKDAILRADIEGPSGLYGVQTYQVMCTTASSTYGVRFRLPEPGEYVLTFRSAMQDPIVHHHITNRRGRGQLGHQHTEKGKTMSGPPALVAEGYVFAKITVGLRITNLFAWADKASLSSPAFAESTPFPLEIKTEEGRRFARASIPIAEVDAGEYVATLHLPHGMTQQLRVIVEDAGDGTCEASWAKVPDGTGNLHYLKASGLSRNASHAEAKTTLAHGNDWFGLIKEPYGTNAKGTAVPADGLKPGTTYPVEVKLIFAGGVEHIVKGAVTLPLPEPKAVLPGFKVRHEVNLAALGEADTITHKISFGSRKQTNTEYVVAWTRKCHDPQGKPVKPTREEAAELALLEPYHYVRHLDHVELHTVNPHKLRGNARFKPIYIVKIDPVEDDDSYSGGDEGDEGEHNRR